MAKIKPSILIGSVIVATFIGYGIGKIGIAKMLLGCLVFVGIIIGAIVLAFVYDLASPPYYQ